MTIKPNMARQIMWKKPIWINKVHVPQPIRIQISANVLPRAPTPAKIPRKAALSESTADMSLACVAFIAERISTGKSGNCRHLVLIGPPRSRTRCCTPRSFLAPAYLVQWQVHRMNFAQHSPLHPYVLFLRFLDGDPKQDK